MKQILYLKYIISLICSVIICFGEQIYISDPVIVEDFVGSGFVGDIDGVGNQTMFEVTEDSSYFLSKDKFDNLFFLSGRYENKSIKKVSPNGKIEKLGTNAKFTFSKFFNDNFYIVSENYNTIYKSPKFLDYSIHKKGFIPKLDYIGGMCIDSFGNIYLSYPREDRIYVLKQNGEFSVFVGSGNSGYADGNGIFSSFLIPKHLAIDSSNNIFVNDSGNHIIRKIDAAKNVKLYAGRPANVTFPGLDGERGASSCLSIKSMTCDKNGNLIISTQHSIRIIDKTGFIKTIAGNYYESGYRNSSGIGSRFKDVVDVVSIGNTIYVAESLFPRIRKITIGESSAKKPFDNINIKLSAGITINGTVGKKYSIESSLNGGKQWIGLTELDLPKTPYTWYDENSVGTNNLYRVFETP